MSAWPQGFIPFAIEETIEAVRALERDVQAGIAPPDPAAVRALLTTCQTYVLGLPATIQDATSERIIQAIYGRREYTATVAPRKSAVHDRSSESVPAGAAGGRRHEAVLCGGEMSRASEYRARHEKAASLEGTETTA